MPWYINILVGIIIGGIIFNAKMRKSVLDFLGGLAGKGKSSKGNLISRNGEVEAPPGSYSVSVHCSNCQFKGYALIQKGEFKNQLISQIECPSCGNKTLRG